MKKGDAKEPPYLLVGIVLILVVVIAGAGFQINASKTTDYGLIYLKTLTDERTFYCSNADPLNVCYHKRTGEVFKMDVGQGKQKYACQPVDLNDCIFECECVEEEVSDDKEVWIES